MSNGIRFGTGVAEYTLNDAVTVKMNPTDLAFAERVFQTFDAMDAKQEAYNAALRAETDTAGVFRVAREMDAEMRAMLDGVFGTEICAPLFGSVSVYALSDGLPLWVNLLLAVIDEMDVAFAREQKATNPRIRKYTAKYQSRKK